MCSACPPPPEQLVWTQELVARFWDGFAQTRLAELSFAAREGPSLLTSIDHLLPKGGEILDFGAGHGQLVELICKRGLKVAAYEPSVERSRELAARLAKIEGFLGVVGPDTQKRFDMVIASEVLEHVLDPHLQETVQRLFALTKPEGYVVITVPNNEDLALGQCYCPVSNKLFHRWQHVRSFTGRSLDALMAEAGFERLMTHIVDLSPACFVPYDPVWTETPRPAPDHLLALRANRYVEMPNGNVLLYTGRRPA